MLHLSRLNSDAAVARLGEMHHGIRSRLTGEGLESRPGKLGILRISECEKTSAAYSVVAVALALAVTAEEIIFGNREPTGDKTNLISAEVHQSDSFWLALFSLSPLFAGPNNNKKNN